MCIKNLSCKIRKYKLGKKRDWEIRGIGGQGPGFRGLKPENMGVGGVVRKCGEKRLDFCSKIDYNCRYRFTIPM